VADEVVKAMFEYEDRRYSDNFYSDTVFLFLNRNWSSLPGAPVRPDLNQVKWFCLQQQLDFINIEI